MDYRVKELRQQLNLTQEQLAEKSGVSKGIIVRLESGRQVITKTSTLLKLSKALNCEVSDIFLT